MSQATHDVLGIGNAIFDILGSVQDEVLDRLGVPKGSMRLVDADGAQAVQAVLGEAVRVSGGSAGNTVAGVASLGGRAAFIGKVADDDNGDAYVADMRLIGVDYATPRLTNGTPTAVSAILVTPDGERTMNTYLGASRALCPEDIDPKVVDGAAITFLEGYLFDPPPAKDAFRTAAQRASAAGRLAALTLSDTFCIERHRDDFMDLLASGTIGIVFANAAEARALYQTDDLEDAARRLGEAVPTAVVTRSEEGATVIFSGERVDVPAEETRVVDLTGAGDLFAGGFLLGHARGLSPADSARLGAMAAAEVISHVGARPQTSLADLARAKGFAF